MWPVDFLPALFPFLVPPWQWVILPLCLLQEGSRPDESVRWGQFCCLISLDNRNRQTPATMLGNGLDLMLFFEHTAVFCPPNLDA